MLTVLPLACSKFQMAHPKGAYAQVMLPPFIVQNWIIVQVSIAYVVQCIFARKFSTSIWNYLNAALVSFAITAQMQWNALQ